MEEILIVLGLFAGLVVVFSLFGLMERRKYTALMKMRIHREYGKFQEKPISAERAQCIPSYFKKHRTELSIDDITASDLELDRIFTVMDLTYSAAGEEMLYHTLRTPVFDEEELKHRDGQIRFFDEHEKEREALQYFFAGMGKNAHYSLYDYLDLADTLNDDKSLGLHFLAPVFIVAAIALIFFQTGPGVMALIIAIAVNIGWYFKTKGKIAPYISTLKYIMRDIHSGKKACQMDIPCIKQEQEKMKDALDKLKNFTRGAGAVFKGESASGDPMEVMADYLNMVLHIDLISFYHMFTQMQAHKEEIDILHGTLGYIEMLIAVASYKRALGTVCTPIYDGKEAAKELYHPMIADPVKNSYELKGNMLLTGSNASGKSTFLKTMAINQLFGQCFYFACADEFHTDMHRIYTSMALRDDLASSESYFMVEIKAMRRILDASKTPGPKIACYVDEVLRGTNTVERIAASTVILKSMLGRNIFSAAATHDIELTELLAKYYENYHFEEEIKDGDVLFNYRLMEGKATSRNAIKLLSVMGYDSELVTEAEDLAQKFIKEGAWT
ncbi:MAG: hypothetical protein IKR23_10150 [Lachnospiraceae bacterium]|nr:hypothetical protein [Lachnospiraceae bacterium]